jgi:hypothetical protein
MFMFENDIMLLFIAGISFLKHKVQMMGQRITFPLIVPMVICDDKLQSRHGQCPPSLASIQNTNYHEILQVLMV